MTTNTYGKLYEKDTNVTDDELFHGTTHDLGMVAYELLKITGDVNIKSAPTEKMMEECKCYTTMHGLKILKKLQAIDGLSDYIFRQYQYSMAVILHDVVKYKKRPELTMRIMNLAFNGCAAKFGDHGVDGGIFFHTYFDIAPSTDTRFMFLHAKKRPYSLDPEKIPLHWKAFFVFDDIIKDLDKFKFKMQSSNYEVLNKFYNCPKRTDISQAFSVLREHYNGQLEEN